MNIDKESKLYMKLTGSSVATGSKSGDPDDPPTHWFRSGDLNKINLNLQISLQNNIDNYYEVLVKKPLLVLAH